MTQYGNNEEPGIVSDLTSSASVATSGAAPNNLGLVGQADLANATSPADTGTVYEVTRASKAVERFGPQDSSLLTTGIVDALNEGAYPVYAVAAESTSVTDEDHSGVATTKVDLDNAPLRETAESISVSLDGSDLTVNVVYDDPAAYSPEDGECYVNPVYAQVEVPAVPATSLTVDYDHFDYPGGIDVMVDNAADEIDYLAPLSEASGVVDDANVSVASMEQEYDLAILLAGAEIFIDPSNINSFTQNYDDSRTQVVYPTRFEDNSSALAAYAGLKAQLGLQNTPINKRLSTNKRLSHTLDRGQRGSLIDNYVVPLADDSRGVRIADDPTTVDESNTDERNLNYGFNRKVADYIIGTTRQNQQPFIGRLNSQTVRNTLEGMVNDSLVELQESNAVISFNVNVLKEDAVTAGLEMDVDLVEPLRFIENTVTISNSG
jgi:hypothetical protein